MKKTLDDEGILRAPGLTAMRTGILSLDVPRVTYVVAFLLFATAIGHVLVSGEAKSHIKNLLYSPGLASINPSSVLNDEIVEIVHYANEQEIRIKLLGVRCPEPVFRGRLSGPVLTLMEFSKTEEGFMVGKYVVPVPGTYFVEIIVLSCRKLYQNTSFSLVMDSCIEDTRRHAITAPNASIEISRWSPHPEHKLGFWTLKPGVQAHPLRTRVQPNGCMLPLCDLSEFVTNNFPLDDYTFEYQAGREGPSG